MRSGDLPGATSSCPQGTHPDSFRIGLRTVVQLSTKGLGGHLGGVLLSVSDQPVTWNRSLTPPVLAISKPYSSCVRVLSEGRYPFVISHVSMAWMSTLPFVMP